MSKRIFEQYPPARGTVVTATRVKLAAPTLGTVAVIGFGTMGRAQALNLRRGGVEVVVGCRPGSASIERARSHGLDVRTVAEAVSRADVVMLMLPDQTMGIVYTLEVEPNLGPETAIGFAHGFAVAFDQIQVTEGRPCFLVAPKSQGDMLIQAHEQGRGVPGLLAVTEGSPLDTWDLAAAYALAVGCLEGGGFVTTFRQECVSDQFGEQAVLCGGVIELLKAAFEIMVEGGYGEENAYFECVHELKLITDLLHRYGVDGMRSRISGTAAYGGLTRGPRLIDEGVVDRMKTILAEIENGNFAREFLAGHADPERGIEKMKADEARGPLASAGRAVLPRLHPQDHPDEERSE